MKIECAKEDLSDALQSIQGVVSGKTALPILSNVLLSCEGKNLDLLATDLDVGMRTSIQAVVKRKGAMTLPARRLAGIVRDLPEGRIEIEEKEGAFAELVAGKVYYKMFSLPAKDFPQIPSFEKPPSFEIEQGVLKGIVRRTSFCIAHDETRYSMAGLFIEVGKGQIGAVATDGRRLAIVEREQETEANLSFIMPLKAVVELQRLLDEEGNVRVFVGDNLASFEMGSRSLFTRLVEGHFPNYKQVIPKKSKESVTLEREEFLSAIRRMAHITSEKSNSVKLKFTKDCLTLEAVSPELGESKEEMNVRYGGEDFMIAFNPQYMVDALRNLDTDEILFEFSDALSPGVIRSGEDFLYVIMPMRVG